MSNVRAIRNEMISTQEIGSSIQHPGKVVAKNNRFYARIYDFSGPGREEEAQAVKDLNMIRAHAGSGKPAQQCKRMASAAKWLRGAAQQKQKHARVTRALPREIQSLLFTSRCYETASNQAPRPEAHIITDTVLSRPCFSWMTRS